MSAKTKQGCDDPTSKFKTSSQNSSPIFYCQIIVGLVAFRSWVLDSDLGERKSPIVAHR